MILSAFTIKQFCAMHGISRNLFYMLAKEGKAPKMMSLGRRRIISAESAAEWRRDMENSSPAHRNERKSH